MPKQPLGEQQIYQAAFQYFAEKARWPTASSGSAKPYFGEEITWSGVNQILVKGNRGLPGNNTLSKLIKSRLSLLTSEEKTPAMTSKLTTISPVLKSINGGLGASYDPECLKLLQELTRLPDYSDRVKEIWDQIIQRGWGQATPLPGPDNNATAIEMVDNSLPLLKERIVNGCEAIMDRFLTIGYTGPTPTTPYKLWDANGMTEKALAAKAGSKTYKEVIAPRSEDLEVCLTDGRGGSTVTFSDRNSIGIPASQGKSTILNIGGVNKTILGYHIGAKGIGGSTLCGFSTISVIVSMPDSKACKKMHGDGDPKGWVSIVRKLKMADGISRYCFLEDTDGNMFTLDPNQMVERVPGSILDDMHDTYETMQDSDLSKPEQALEGSAKDGAKAKYAAGLVDWEHQKARPGITVSHYDFDLGPFSAVRLKGDEMYRLISTYMVRTPHAFRLRDCRSLHVWEGGKKKNWKYHRVFLVRGLRARLEASNNCVFGKNGEGYASTTFVNPRTGALEHVGLSIWVVKRKNEELGGLKATNVKYEAEDNVRATLKVKEGEPLLLDHIDKRLEKLLAKKDKGGLSQKEKDLMKDLNRVRTARTTSVGLPALSYIVGEKGHDARHPRGTLFTFFGITHHTETSYSFWRDVGMAAMYGRAVVEIRLDDLSPECRDKFISSRRESIRTTCAEFKSMMKAVHDAMSQMAGSTRLGSIYDEIKTKANEDFTNSDKDLSDRVSAYVNLVESLKVHKEENKPKTVVEWPVGQSVDGALRNLEIVIPKGKLKKDNTVYIRLPSKSGKKLNGGRFTLRLYGDAADGYNDPLSTAMVVMENAGGSVVGTTAFSKGHAAVTVQWDGGKSLKAGDEGELFLIVTDPATGHRTSNKVAYQVCDKRTSSGEGEGESGDVVKRPDVVPHAVTHNHWTTGGRNFDATTVAEIVPDLPNNRFDVFVNIDNALLKQELLRRLPKDSERETKLDNYLAWLAGYLYSVEHGRYGYDHRKPDDKNDFTELVKREEHQEFDYEIALRMWIADLPKPKKAKDELN